MNTFDVQLAEIELEKEKSRLAYYLKRYEKDSSLYKDDPDWADQMINQAKLCMRQCEVLLEKAKASQ